MKEKGNRLQFHLLLQFSPKPSRVVALLDALIKAVDGKKMKTTNGKLWVGMSMGRNKKRVEQERKTIANGDEVTTREDYPTASREFLKP
ncbi:CLUMA_CG000892, isoform A [Clunio marinus]|uniref:CLUMA_CG000892, isoform A n=1 Tax=Clunio marinus TaxID=568069 RepID=A0A1J1HHL8_9DIPT|nr:CLUMA_CG000892, isoform A [Clunio marinus]